jgi:hypothetical protein
MRQLCWYRSYSVARETQIDFEVLVPSGAWGFKSPLPHRE